MRVSICIPVYKHLDLFQRCLYSILEQSFQDYEIIVTDDSPTDEFSSISVIDKRIVYLKNEKPLGSPGNWNKAISLARGEYIKIMHQDDWFSSPNALLLFVQALDNNPNVQFAFSGCCDIGENIFIERYISNKTINRIKNNPEILYFGNLIGAPSVTIFRNGFEFYFDENLIWLVDLEFYIRFLTLNPNLTVCSELLVNIGISESQITNKCISDKRLVIKEYIYVYDKLFAKKNKLFKYALLKNFALFNIYTNSDLNLLQLDTTFKISLVDVLLVFFFKIWELLIVCLKKTKKYMTKLYGNCNSIGWTW